ncbi:hypothetical protein A3746_09615 [Oleibacter sp. HI0075]|nr:hypothetical protein A3746_09615 [Oleibacter sp. HI0075]
MLAHAQEKIPFGISRTYILRTCGKYMFSIRWFGCVPYEISEKALMRRRGAKLIGGLQSKTEPQNLPLTLIEHSGAICFACLRIIAATRIKSHSPPKKLDKEYVIHKKAPVVIYRGFF